MRLEYILLISFVLLSCSKGSDKAVTTQEDSLATKGVYSALTLDEYNAFYNLDSTAVKPGELIDLTVDFDCAILTYPDEEAIDEMIKAYGEEDFYIIADDNNWYHGMAIELLDSVGIKMVTIHGDSLKLKGESKTWSYDIKKDSLSGWNIIFFNRTKEPQIISTADLTTDEIRDYFDIQE